MSSSMAQSSTLRGNPFDSLRANSMVIIGDSITYYNYGIPSRTSMDSRGWFTHGNSFLGHRISLLANTGIGGDTAQNIRTRIQGDAIAYNPGWVHLLVGTNDITNGRTTQQLTNDIAALYDALAVAGIRIVAGTIPPRNGDTGTQKKVKAESNLWIRQQSLLRRGMILADYAAACTDPATGNWVAGYVQADGTHPAVPGAIAMGKVLADALSPYIPATSLLMNDGTSTSNLLLNGGGRFPGAASAVPTGWVAQGFSQGAPTYSKVARTDNIPGNWQQVAVPSVVPTSRGYLLSTSIPLSGGTYAVGDRIVGTVEYQADTLDATPDANTQGLYAQIQYYDGSAFTLTSDAAWDTTTAYENMGNRARSGVFQTAPLTITAGTTGQYVQMLLHCRGGGNYRWDRAAIFKV